MIRGNPVAEVGKLALRRCNYPYARPKPWRHLERLGLVGAALLALLTSLERSASAACRGNRPACECVRNEWVPSRARIEAQLAQLLRSKKDCVVRQIGPRTRNPAFNRTLEEAIQAGTRLITPGPGQTLRTCSDAEDFVEEKSETLENIGAQVLQRAIQVETLFSTFKEKMSRSAPNDPEKFLVVPNPNLPFKKAKKFLKKLPQTRGGGLTDFAGSPERIVRGWLAEQLERKVLTYIAGSEYIDRVYGPLPPDPNRTRPCTYPPVLGLYQGFGPNLLNLFSVNPETNGGCPTPGTKAAILKAFPGWEHCHVINPFNKINERLKGRNGDYTDEKYSRSGNIGFLLSHRDSCQGSGSGVNLQYPDTAIERGADLQEAANYIINGYFVELHFVLLDTFKKEIMEKGRIPSPEIFDAINSDFGIDKAKIEALRTKLQQQYGELVTHAKQNLSAPGMLDCDDLEGGYVGRTAQESGSSPSTSNSPVDTQRTGLRSNQIRVCLLQAAQVELESASALKLATSSYLQASFRLQEFLERSGSAPTEDVRSCNN